jgi:hypothetical protein
MKVAITGHQNLGDKDTIGWLETKLEFKIHQLNVEQGYSCLAVGADQLFAKVILKNKIPLVAVIPSYDYETTFSISSISSYKLFLSKASQKFQLPYKNATETAFYEASKFMLDKCDILIAVWNGKPAEGFGGTADVVNYAKIIQKKIIHLNPLTKTIKNL